MFRDQEEELSRLSEELKAQEEADRQAEAEDMLDALLEDDTHIEDMEDGVYKNASNDYGGKLRNYASGYQAYNADRTDVDMEDFSHHVKEQEEKTPSLKGWVILALILTLGIIGIVVFWIFWLTSGGIAW